MLVPAAALLLALVAAAGVALWYARRRGMALALPLPGKGRRLRVVERLALGRRSALLVVEYEGRALLLGQSGEQLSLLSERRPSGAGPDDAT